ncbi:hypothetical protein [Niallia oryzisoli]|uniref:hypothetical protein n=1 Tax=Niallia oryzisoli TaxID=1737571 RepID=UPI0037368527
MFDPTAFENMRVVMEGCFYDKDLNGEIKIVDRNDGINTAKLSRTYDLSIQLALPNPNVICRFSLLASIENLTAELLPSLQSNKHTGCMVTIEFLFDQVHEKSIMKEVEAILKQIWGTERIITLIYCYEPLVLEQKGRLIAQISFNRLISEDQIDDLLVMTDYMLLTLERLEGIL